MDKLKPCPFCGNEKTVVSLVRPVFMLQKFKGRLVAAGCPKCGASTGLYNARNHTGSPLMNKAHEEMAEKDAIDAWNKRLESSEWIPVTERLPEKPFGCLLAVWYSTYNGDVSLNLLPYFAGWDGERWNDADGDQVPFEVEYWMPLPEPPKE